jgi:hypothetical protein
MTFTQTVMLHPILARAEESTVLGPASDLGGRSGQPAAMRELVGN